MSDKEQLGVAVVGLLVLGVALSSPLWMSGFPMSTYDGHIHSLWCQQFSMQFWAGEWYPRWLTELNGGFGSPVFFFYPPLPHLVTAILHPFTSEDSSCSRALGISAGLSFLLSGTFALLWLRRLVPLWPAVGGAVCYLLAPYHLVGDLYMRGAFAEFWGMTWLPLILWRVHPALAGKAESRVSLACACALLITSHLPTALLFAIVPGAYAMAVGSSGNKLRALFHTLVSMAPSVSLAAVYLLPALTLQWAASMQELTRTGYEAFFFLSGFPYAFKTRLFWLVLSMVAAGAFMATLALSVADATRKRQALFWCAAAALSFFMMFSCSKPIWEFFPTLQIVQFPWRFGTVLSLATAALVALGLAAIRLPLRWHQVAGSQVAYVIMLAWLCITIHVAWPLLRAQTPMEINPLLRDVSEYLPKWANAPLETTLAKFRPPGAPSVNVALLEGNGSVEVRLWKPRRIEIMANLTVASPMLVAQYYFPGWKARLNGNPANIQISEPEGLLKLSLPAGRHSIDLRLEPTIQERWGLVISGASLLMAGTIFTRAKWKFLYPR